MEDILQTELDYPNVVSYPTKEYKIVSLSDTNTEQTVHSIIDTLQDRITHLEHIVHDLNVRDMVTSTRLTEAENKLKSYEEKLPAWDL